MAKYYTGLDVSMDVTNIATIDSRGEIVFEASVKTDPQVLHSALQEARFPIEKISLESGSWSHWLITELSALGWNITCIDARSISPLLALKTNKTDRNDARGIAEAVRTASGYIREVYQKSQDSIDMKTLLSARRLLVEQRTALSNCIRGLLKSYGLRLTISHKNPLPETVSSVIQEKWNVLEENHPAFALKKLALVFEGMSKEIDSIDQRLLGIAKKSDLIKRFMTVPGVGTITAITYQTVIDNPHRFKNPRFVGAYLGMCPKQYSSGQTKRLGRVSKRGSKELRTLLAGSGLKVLTQCRKDSTLRIWGLRIAEKHGKKKASMAVGRKISVILHRIWSKNTTFQS